MGGKRSFFGNYKAWRQFNALPMNNKRIVFYSEGKTYWPFLRPYVKALIDTTDEQPIYVSSEIDDPGLTYCPERMKGFAVGEGAIRTLWFSSLKAKVLIMSMPDLQVFHIKRSMAYPVNYVYAPHGCASVHMILREKALDYFDTVFLSGPHNEKEIRRREELKGLKKKTLFNIGYPYLDELIATAEREGAPYPDGKRPLRVLLAPSWAEKGAGTLETVGNELIGLLLEAGFETIVRLHPLTRKLHPDCIEAIRRSYSGHHLFKLEADTTGKRTLMNADIMISDWSAIAMEFSFSRLRPVLYIDVPRKAINPHYEEIDIQPFEVKVRNEIGAVLHPDKIHDAPEVILRLSSDFSKRGASIRKIRDENVFNIGQSAVKGAEALVQLANNR
jgi:YidC/Oxa1 family membrane protein insertase